MIYGSVCSGIEAATVAWHPLGWKAAWYSEIEPFPCKLLQHYYPQTPNLGDMLKIKHNEHFQRSIIDVLVGGTPCQSFSTAGLRGGLADDRGNLALEFCRILIAKRPRWFVWENVPGVHSSFSYEEGSSRMDREGRTEGREFTETADFASILTAFLECGYNCSWRVLDAQFCGVPQRRRRVFVVGYLGDDWRPSAAVLFEPEGVCGNPPKSGKKRTGVAALTKNGVGASGADDNQAQAGHIISALTTRPYADNESQEDKLISGTIDASYGRLQGASGQDGGHGHSTLVIAINTQVGLREHKEGDCTGMGIGADGDPSFTIQKAHHHAVCYSIMPMNSCKDYKAREVEVTQPVTTNQGIANNGGDLLLQGAIVRKLTPLECERLQGFPDNYTAIPGAADSPRYESIGNSMAVPVMRRIGKRIDMVDKIFNK